MNNLLDPNAHQFLISTYHHGRVNLTNIVATQNKPFCESRHDDSPEEAKGKDVEDIVGDDGEMEEKSRKSTF